MGLPTPEHAKLLNLIAMKGQDMAKKKSDAPVKSTAQDGIAPLETVRFGAGGLTSAFSGLPDPVAYLGGKGAHLCFMDQMGVPVPPGFIFPTKYCVETMQQEAPEPGEVSLLDRALVAAEQGLAWLTTATGYTPLVSVRSGAPVSMPGMMDTILNVGLCDKNLAEWAGRIGGWAAIDSYRRLMQMLGTTAAGIPAERFETAMRAAREKDGVATDREISLETLAEVVDQFREIWSTGSAPWIKAQGFPQDPRSQLRMAIDAVWGSWNNERARVYRDSQKIPHDMGTAIVVQAMVFGNLNDNSGSGVLFTRNPNTGERRIMAEFLPCAQGEDVVAGTRTPEALEFGEFRGEGLSKTTWMGELAHAVLALESHYRDVQDVEFTVQDGKLFLLQTRSAKRSAQAAIRIATDMWAEGLISEKDVVERITARQFLIARRPTVAPKAKNKVLGTGLAACPGVGIGVIATTSKQAVTLAKAGKRVILVAKETTPDDIEGMMAASGILTQTGGATSHAAVVARAMDRPCVVGCSAIEAVAAGAVRIGGTLYDAGSTVLSIDGLSGRVYAGEVPVLDALDDESMRALEALLLEVSGVSPRSMSRLVRVGDTLRGSLVAAEWPLDVDLTELAKTIAAHDGPVEVYFDMTQPSAHHDSDHDRRLLQTRGETHLTRTDAAWRAAAYGAIIKAAGGVKNGLQRAVLTGVDADARKDFAAQLKKAGVPIVMRPTTVADLLSGNVCLPDKTFMTTVVGGDDAWMLLRELAESKGMKLAAPVDARTVERVAFDVLA